MELPAGWVSATLGDVADWGSGGTPKSGVSDYYGGDIPWVVSGDLNDKTIHSATSTITSDGLNSSSAKWVPEGSVLVAMYGATIGKLGITGRPLTTNQAVAFASPYQNLIDKRFLFWYLRSQRDALRKTGKGGAQPNISQTILKAWPIPVPPLAEQHRIVEVLENHLSRLDAAEDLLLLAHGRSKQLVQRFITRQLENAPVRLLRDLLEAPLINGRSVPSEEGGFPVLRLTALKTTALNLAARKEGRWSAEDAAPFLVAKGDFFVSRGNGSRSLVGRGALLDRVPAEPVAFPDTMIRIRANSSTILPGFLQAVWDCHSVRQHIETSARTTAGIYKINQSILGRTPILLPPLEEQRSILTQLDTLLPPLERAQQGIAQTRARGGHLRASLLNCAFSGRLVPQDPTDEPASVLLDRIRVEREAQGGKVKRGTRRPRKAAEPAPPPAPASTPSPAHAVQQELPL
ncbi:restriction endonuclease subunit S [Streptomyces erythrochromogenes]|uniref:restriction endonuclease subunit S n=1 Tax=Streptomyces erythrochromogenes TaxID=285574 RepID=UPI002250C352|nr:restriction endonuclease subunit S [Streptomyces erythrochromogenes]MCX5584492.1 restriction endonuclease subunit S [Streptomyces erythrochromogenes]